MNIEDRREQLDPVLELIYENINLMTENIKLISAKKRLEKKVEELEKFIKKHYISDLTNEKRRGFDTSTRLN